MGENFLPAAAARLLSRGAGGASSQAPAAVPFGPRPGGKAVDRMVATRQGSHRGWHAVGLNPGVSRGTAAQNCIIELSRLDGTLEIIDPRGRT